MSTPRVSVIIPNYNHAPYLVERIESVLAQTFQDFEVLLLDDGSTDGSDAILEGYRGNERVVIVKNERNGGGVFKQWNKGLALCQGGYVWIAESDDRAEPEFLETLLPLLEADPAVAVAFCNSYREDAAGVTDGLPLWFGEMAPQHREDFVREGNRYVTECLLFRCTLANASAVLFRRDAARQMGGADESFRLSGDWLFWVRMLEGRKVAYTPRTLNYFRHHDKTVRSAAVREGIAIREAYRIVHYIVDHFPLTAERRRKAELHMTDWFAEVMTGPGRRPEGSAKAALIQEALRLDSGAMRRVWAQRTGLRWLSLGLRRRWREWSSAPAAVS